MCGIVGYIGHQKAVPVLLEGLQRLEYRGYDSAGVAILQDGKIRVEKTVGKLEALKETLEGKDLDTYVGIGHTRWATHGAPSTANAHPHMDCTGKFVIVHNGIIENYLALREELQHLGHEFKSETDTEILAHLIEQYDDGDLESTVKKALKRVDGSFALGVLDREEPNRLIAVRKDSPLVIGIGQGENFIASDIPAILKYTKKAYILNDYEMAIVTKDHVEIKTLDGEQIENKEVFEVKWDAAAAEKGGYEHFMLKEIHEQPKAIKDTLSGRLDLDNGQVVLDEVKLPVEQIKNIKKVFITACGTAYHAGLMGKYMIEDLVRVPVEVDIASEFRYRNPIIDNETLIIVVSQSGETADTLAAMREAKQKGARVVAVTNVVGSSVAREADDVIYTWAGPEIAVASTKAYTTQLIAMYLLSLYFAQVRETLSKQEIKGYLEALNQLPEQAEAALKQDEDILQLVKAYAKSENAFFLGRSLDAAVAMEGALKLKEISYIHAEAYAAGELKHGTLALITEGIPVITLATQQDVYDKTISNIKEVTARGADVIAVAFDTDTQIQKSVNHVLTIPLTEKYFTPVLSVIPLQMLAYYMAIERGCDVDKPRNLAKSVTVE